MNVYDFDNTIFDGDSSLEFLKYLIKKNPLILKNNLPHILGSFVNYKLFSKDVIPFKESIFSLIKYLPDLDSFLDEFWAINIKKIKRWYLSQKKDDDVIISASPYFLLNKVSKYLGVVVIGTKMNSSGNIVGLNNKGEEKVRVFREIYPDAVIENFYSDSLSDTPMALISKNAYLLRDDKFFAWPTTDKMKALY